LHDELSTLCIPIQEQSGDNRIGKARTDYVFILHALAELAMRVRAHGQPGVAIKEMLLQILEGWLRYPVVGNYLRASTPFVILIEYIA
jgi:hypothetical protein